MKNSDVALQLKGTHQKITQIMQAKITEYDLTFGLLHILMLIERNPNANQKQLAKDMNFTQGSMSIAVKRLIKKDMLKQVPLETDMRYNRLILTVKGKSMIDDYKDHVSAKYESIFYGFEEEELTQLHEYLLKINNNLQDIRDRNSLSNLEE